MQEFHQRKKSLRGHGRLALFTAGIALAVAVPVTAAHARPEPSDPQAAAVEPAPGPEAEGTAYTAMGSSFAAGPGIPPLQSGSGASTCSRSDNNYPSIVAHDTGAELTDVSCSGATTANVLTDSQGSQPPQVQAVTSATRVVTVTVGGNDVDYLGSLDAYTCQSGGGTGCATVDRNAIEETFGMLTGRLENIVNAVHSASPLAQVYLVNYFTILPDAGACAGVPLTDDQLAFERSIATRLAAATAKAATDAGASLVDLAAASHGHDACSLSPWVETGRPPAGRVRYHPNEEGMRGAAAAVEAALASPRAPRDVVIHSGIRGRCVDAGDSDAADGAPVRLHHCDSTDGQRWTYRPAAGSTLQAQGKCLAISEGGADGFTDVGLRSCDGSGAQRWVAGPHSALVNLQSGRCLDDPDSSTSVGIRLHTFDCNGTAAQRWRLTTV
ncbi:GDSL-type esterase/lipase family protein [Streptomyces sp. NPDC049936]|uniref:GDSL-type esterase/lipase family protein n=1 Tax=Streptomyces sp. NPDC049936 TaxID=3365599 RepID=UPI00379D161E